MRQGFWTSRVHLYDKGVLFHQRNPCQRCTKRCHQDLSVAAQCSKKKAQLPKVSEIWLVLLSFWNAPLFGRYAELVPAQAIPLTCQQFHSRNLTNLCKHLPFGIVTKSLTSRFFSTAGSLVSLQIDSPFIPSQLPPFSAVTPHSS